MDLEDLFTGGHRRKHGDHHDQHDKHAYRSRDHDDHDHAPSHRGHEDDHYGPSVQGHRPEYGHHGGGHDMLRTLTHLSGTVPHFKSIVAVLAVGLVLVLIVGGTLAVMLFPVIGKALGFASQTAIQGTIESVIPPGGIKGAIESVVPPGGVKGAVEAVVPATGLKGTVDSTVGVLERIWYGKPAEAPPKAVEAGK